MTESVSASPSPFPAAFRPKALRVVIAGKRPAFVGAEPDKFVMPRSPMKPEAFLYPALPKVAGKQPAGKRPAGKRPRADLSGMRKGTRADLMDWAERANINESALVEFGRDWSAFVAADMLVGLPLSPSDLKRLAEIKAAQSPSPTGSTGRGAIAGFSPCTTKGGVVLVRCKYDAAVFAEVLSAAVEMRYPIADFPSLLTTQKRLALPVHGTPASWHAYWSRFDCGIAAPNISATVSDVKQLPLVICATHIFVPVTYDQVLCLLATGSGVTAWSFSDLFVSGSTAFAYVALCSPKGIPWHYDTTLRIYSTWSGALVTDSQHDFLRKLLVAIGARTNGNNKPMFGIISVPPRSVQVLEEPTPQMEEDARQALTELGLMLEKAGAGAASTTAEDGLWNSGEFDCSGQADADCGDVDMFGMMSLDLQ